MVHLVQCLMQHQVELRIHCTILRTLTAITTANQVFRLVRHHHHPATATYRLMYSTELINCHHRRRRHQRQQQLQQQPNIIWLDLCHRIHLVHRQ